METILKFLLTSISRIMFGLGTLLEASLLFLNAVAVLHEERFLKKFGLADDSHQGFGEPGMKQQIIKFINSVRTVMRGESKNLSYFFKYPIFTHCSVPLIGLNIVSIVYLMLLG